jgi:diazepam-binding inhibitor (GABA receptor modulating acyl-CoA-binding protein)
MSRATFRQATEAVKTWKKRPTDAELLQLYGLYKQATEGDNNAALSMWVVGRARFKWQAWNAQKGVSREQAQDQYVSLVDQLRPRYA